MELKAGDKVFVRPWNELVALYGIDVEGDINCTPCFFKPMQHYCGTLNTIKNIRGNWVRLEGSNANFVKNSLHLQLSTTQDTIQIVEMDTTIINSFIKEGYTIREFHNGKCVLTYNPTIKLKKTNEKILYISMC